MVRSKSLRSIWLILQNLYQFSMPSKTDIGQIKDMRAYGRKTKRSGRPRTSDRNLQLIRDLCAERARLVEEVKQLSAAVQVYKEVARRTSAAVG
jgi:hypothetical protein